MSDFKDIKCSKCNKSMTVSGNLEDISVEPIMELGKRLPTLVIVILKRDYNCSSCGSKFVYRDAKNYYPGTE